MIPQTLVGCALSGLAGAGMTYFLVRHSENPHSTITENKLGPHLPFGLPSTLNVKLHSGYVAGYDRRLRIPAWSYEILSNSSPPSLPKRSNKFLADKSVPREFRVTSDYYTNTGYDRGHMTPAADVRQSQEAMDETFLMTNICPQNAGLNRRYWAAVERFLRDVVAPQFDALHVITGPLFLPVKRGNGKWEVSYEVIGKESSGTINKSTKFGPSIAVPTHFFKVVLAEHGKEKFLAAFVMPNQEIQSSADLSSFLVDLKEVESHSGLQFFPLLLHNQGPEHPKKVHRAGKSGSSATIYKASKTNPDLLCNHIKCDLRTKLKASSKLKTGDKKIKASL